MRFAVTRTQHAVGQGGFHTGWITTGGGALAWVYDCGALGGEGPARLSEAIGRFAGRLAPAPRVAPVASFGALFLSHLDRDHVNGVPELLRRCQPQHAFLPYLSPAERLAVVIEDCRAVGAPARDWYVEFARDPDGWLRGQGVPKVYVVHPSGGGAPPAEARDSDPAPDRPDRVDDLRFDTRRLREVQNPDAQQADRTHVADDAPISVADGGSAAALDWMLLMHVNRADAKLGRFERSINSYLRRRNTTLRNVLSSRQAAAEILADADALNELARVYSDVWRGSGGRNNTSLSLYSGVARSLNGAAMCTSGEPSPLVAGRCPLWPWSWPECLALTPPDALDRAGWLSTGDAPLGKSRFRKQFLRHFDGVRERVGTLVLPHHGSRHSFRAELIDRLGPRHVIAAAGRPNQYDHPHTSVVLETLARASSFALVHEDPDSAASEVTLVVP